MRYLLIILFVFFGLTVFAQPKPVGFPVPNAPTAFYQIGNGKFDSTLILPNKDTGTYTPRFPGNIVSRIIGGDSSIFYYTGQRWIKILKLGDVTGGVTQVNSGFGITGGPITSTGTLRVDTTRVTGIPSYFYVDSLKASIVGGITQLTGDVTAGPGSGSQVATIGVNVVTDAKFRQSAGLSVIGRSANTTGNVADITASLDGQVLRRSGTTIGFGALNLASANAVTGILPGGNVGLTATFVGYGSSGGTLTGEGALIYDETQNRFSNDTTTISRLQVGVITNFTADSLLVFSDSYGAGVGASDIAHAFPRLLAAQLQLILVNYSISGSTLESRVPIDPYGGSPQNLVAQTAALGAGTSINKVARRKYVLIAKGLNDIGWNSANYTPTNYSTDYQTVINLFISKGWAANELILVTPWYITTPGYASYASTTGTTQATATRHLQFVDTVLAIASRYGCKVFDIYRSEAANAGAGLLSTTDVIHPSDNGHSYIAGQIGAYMTQFFSVLRNNQNIASNGLNDLYRLRLPGLDTMNVLWEPRILALDTANKVVQMPSNGVILSNLTTLPQSSTINVGGKIIQNALGITFQSTSDVAGIITNGGVKGNWMQFTGTLPGGMLGIGLEGGLVGANAYIGGYNRTAGSAVNLFVSGLGGIVSVGAFTTSGSQPFQALGGYFNGTVGIGINAPARKLDVVIDDGSNTSVVYSIRGTHTTTGTAANGIGTGLELGWENASGTSRIGGSIESFSTDVVNATEDADMIFRNIRAGAITEAFRVSNIGTGTFQGQLNINSVSNGANTDSVLTISGNNVRKLAVTDFTGGVNIYNANGSLTGDRVVTMGANDILFSGASAGSSFIASVQDQVGIASGTSYIQLTGGLHFKNTQSSDANLTVTENMTQIYLDTISASRNVVLPTTNVGGVNSNQYYLINDNNENGFVWTPTGQLLKDANNNTITALDNKTAYIIRAESNGFNDYFKIVSVSGNIPTVSSSAGTLTLSYSTYTQKNYVFTGTSTTWTLPAVSATRDGFSFAIKNAGTVNITLNSSGGGNDIYDVSAVNTLVITPGQGRILTLKNSIFYVN